MAGKHEILMARLSDSAYKNIRNFKDGQHLLEENWKCFQPVELLEQDKFFTVINEETKEAVVVFKGSEPSPFDLEGIISDWVITDTGLVIGKTPVQFYSGRNYLNAAKELIPNDFKIYVTGHSLGGSLVQLLCMLEENKHIQGYTYNAYGVKHLMSNLKKEGFALSKTFDNISNFSVETDLVSNHNEHIGKVFVVKYRKNFIQTIASIFKELPKILVDIPFKIKKSIKYYFYILKLFFVKIDGHLMNNFISDFQYEERE